MKAIKEVTEIIDLLYKHGWDERNGGNLSYILTEEEALEIAPKLKPIREYKYAVDLSLLVGKYLIITGTGKYFKNCLKDPRNNLGLVYVHDKNTLWLLWGLEDGGRTTSETPTHLLCHIERLKVDPTQRVVMHCHPDNVIAMTHVVPLDNDKFTEILWKMQTESIVVFPEGVAVLPWILCGGTKIGIETSKLMKEYRSVIWAQHGIFCTGKDLDEVFGLIETIEKAASIYMKICNLNILQSITNENLKEIAAAFNLNYKKGIID